MCYGVSALQKKQKKDAKTAFIIIVYVHPTVRMALKQKQVFTYTLRVPMSEL